MTSLTSIIDYSSQYYNATDFGQQQNPPWAYYTESDITMLVEEAEKLYNKLVKELVDESISDYTFSITSSSLPLLSPSDEKEQQSHPRQTAAAIQSNIDTAEPRFVQSEIDNENQDK